MAEVKAKGKVGRPPSGADNMKPLAVKLTPEDKKALRIRAIEEDKSLTGLVADVLHSWINGGKERI